MRHVVTRVLPYAPEQLFHLVGDVARYPEFIPWITSMRVYGERMESEGVRVLNAEAGVGFAFLRERFATWVRCDAGAGEVTVGLLNGPFRRLHNRWRFPVDPLGTRVEFEIDFEFKVRLLERLLAANFDLAVGRLIACFEDEARRRYPPINAG